MMQVALIPPYGLENYALRSRFHMALGLPMLMRRGTYRNMYQRAKVLGDFVILDNGIAEGQQVVGSLLKDYANTVRCDELVLPDVLDNVSASVDATITFLRNEWNITAKYHGMAVLQGTSLKQLRSAVDRFAQYIPIKTLGIPRRLITVMDQLSIRIDLAQWITEQYGARFEIHLLGTAPTWPAEVKAAAQYAPQIRSVDTSMPFNYSLQGATLMGGRVQSHMAISRPKNYFLRDHSRTADLGLVRSNIQTFMEWSNATIREETSASELRKLPTV